MKKERTSIQLWFQKGLLLGTGVVLLLVTGLMMPHVVAAETMYSYIDEHGTPVLTNNYNNIPERYRAKVKTIEQSVRQPSQTASFVTIQQTVTSWAKNIAGTLDGLVPEISGLTPHQSKVATTAGVVGVICVIAMFMSRSQAVKFLSLWILILLGITIPVILYTSQEGVGDVMKGKATDAAKKQQDRLQQVP